MYKYQRSLECHKCGRWVENIGDDAVKVTCAMCVLKAVGFPKEKKSYTPTGRPAGWHWMAEFVDKDGNVFHRGKEQPKLKGTLPPTKVSPPKKKTKRRTQEQILLDRAKDKKAALRKAVQKQKDFLNHNIDKG
tara:strand:+ start:154 stop:552 length:399 start_codon:yes stop_codon:yes gene_type:complete